jgi:hypothetical protein
MRKSMLQKTMIFSVLLAGVLPSLVLSVQLAVLPELNRPGIIKILGDEIFVLDEVRVKVYSLKDYRLLRQFGKIGDGPGELKPNDEIPLQMQVVNNQVFLNSQTKFIHYAPSGKMLKEKATHFMCMQIIPIGRHYAISKVQFTKTGQIFFRVNLYDAELNMRKTIYQSPPSPTLRSSGKLLLPSNFLYMAVGTAGDRLYLFSGRQDDFLVPVFDLEGNPLKPVKMEFSPPRWTEDFKREVLDWFKVQPRFRARAHLVAMVLEYPTYLPAIRNILVEDNRLYVQTYRKKKNLSLFFVFDKTAKPLNSLFLPDQSRYPIKMNPDITFTIHDNFFYYLRENADREQWELHRAPVSR